MAAGGEVEHFCSKARAHNPDCEYFADGGQAAPDFIPDADAPQDSQAPAVSQPPQAEAPDFIPDDQVPHAPQSPQAANAPDFIPDGQTPEEKYGTPLQRLGTVAEGAARGFAGPLATAAELGLSKLGVPGLTAEDQAGREAVNPIEHGVAEATGFGLGMATGYGEARLLANAASKVTVASKIGSGLIKGMIEMGGLQAGDELSKAMLGTGGDPAHVVSNVLVAGGLGAITGAIFTQAASKLAKLQDGDLTNKLNSFLIGMAEGTGDAEITSLAGRDLIKIGEKEMIGSTLDASARKWGKKLASQHLSAMSASAVAIGGAEEGYRKDGMSGALTGAMKGAVQGALLGAGVHVAKNKIALPVVIKVLESGYMDHMASVLHYASKVAQGENAIGGGIHKLFQGGVQQAWDKSATDVERETLDKYLDSGEADAMNPQTTPTPQGFAKGGEVSHTANAVPTGIEGVAAHYPDQALLLSMARSRVCKYLNDTKPQKHQAKLPYDEEPLNHQQIRTHRKAMDMAIQPMSILNKVKNGSLLPEDVIHFKALYPELHEHLSKKMQEQIVKQQLEGDKVPYRTRQGLSTFLGAPIDSVQSQMNIAAAQGVFAGQKAQMQAASQVKRGTAPLSKTSKQYETGDQAAEARSKA